MVSREDMVASTWATVVRSADGDAPVLSRQWTPPQKTTPALPFETADSAGLHGTGDTSSTSIQHYTLPVAYAPSRYDHQRCNERAGSLARAIYTTL